MCVGWLVRASGRGAARLLLPLLLLLLLLLLLGSVPSQVRSVARGGGGAFSSIDVGD
jgi:hypothetical protein